MTTKTRNPLAIIACILIAALAAREVYDFIYVNKGLEYYSTDVSHILHVVVITVVGTLLFVGYERASPKRKRQFRIACYSLLAATGAWFLADSTYFCTRLYLFVRDAGYQPSLRMFWLPVGLLAGTGGVLYLLARELRHSRENGSISNTRGES